MPLLAVFLASQLAASQLVIPVADQPPTLDFVPGCRDSVALGDTIQTQQSCENDEKSARDDLAKRWNQFAQADKDMCTHMTKNFDPSYVELLSCLEMMRDAKTPTTEQQTKTSDNQQPSTNNGANNNTNANANARGGKRAPATSPRSRPHRKRL